MSDNWWDLQKAAVWQLGYQFRKGGYVAQAKSQKKSPVRLKLYLLSKIKANNVTAYRAL